MEDDDSKAQDQYKKFPEMRRDDVLKLLSWIEQQPHLPNITEFEAIHFFHSCYHDMDKAKSCVENYYTFRTSWPEVFCDRDVFGNDITNSMNICLLTTLPGLTKEGYKVIYCKITDSDYRKFTSLGQLRFFALIVDFCLHDEGIAAGHIMVCDMSGIVFGHMTRMSIWHMRKFIHYLQDALPFRLKALHYVNTVWFVHKMLGIIRPFMKKELQDMLHLHSNVDSLLPFVPLDMLPGEYGGKAGTFNEIQENYYAKVKDNAGYFLKEEKTRRTNENLRQHKSNK